jgi:hypothetical protein
MVSKAGRHEADALFAASQPLLEPTVAADAEVRHRRHDERVEVCVGELLTKSLVPVAKRGGRRV